MQDVIILGDLVHSLTSINIDRTYVRHVKEIAARVSKSHKLEHDLDTPR